MRNIFLIFAVVVSMGFALTGCSFHAGDHGVDTHFL